MSEYVTDSYFKPTASQISIANSPLTDNEKAGELGISVDDFRRRYNQGAYAPEPPKPGVMGGTVGITAQPPIETVDVLRLLRRVEALERAVNGRVSE